jgi:hypothetical protein
MVAVEAVKGATAPAVPGVAGAPGRRAGRAAGAPPPVLPCLAAGCVRSPLATASPPARRRRSRAAAVALAALLLAAAPAARADDFLERYKGGLAAAEQGDWAAAAGHFEAALADRAEESAKLPGRFYFKAYLPHYQLGVARAEQGDCRGALAAFAESERQGVIAGREEAGDLAARRDRCRERVAAADAAGARAVAALERAAAADAALAAAAAAPELAAEWGRGEPSLAARARAARAELAAARAEQAAHAGRASDPAPFAAVEARADAARAALDTLAAEARGLGDRLRFGREAAVGRLAAARAAAEAALRLLPPPADSPPGLAALRREVEAALRATGGDEAPATASAADLDGRAQRIERATARLEAAAAPPPAPLAAAVAAYFAGDYGHAVTLLGDAALAADARARPHALLLRAAARFALATGAAGGEELLAAARADAAACRAADPRLDPPAALFSPRFRAFFRAAAGGG